MKINEVTNPTVTKVFSLANLLRARAKDTGAKPDYSTDAFIKMAQTLGAEITVDQLQQMAGEPPLNAVLNPMEPNAAKITFKIGQEQPVEMPVDKAEQIVAKAAKSALKRSTK